MNNINNNINIYLIGFRCTGKTTLGKMIAQKLGWSFVDLDAMVTDRAGKTVEALVAESGWEKFRRFEKEVLGEVSRQKGIVVATGGGIVLDPENSARLKNTGHVIWLTASPEVIVKRMKIDTSNLHQRPSLTGEGMIDEVEEVLKEREALYRAAAHQVIDTEKTDLETLVTLILDQKTDA